MLNQVVVVVVVVAVVVVVKLAIVIQVNQHLIHMYLHLFTGCSKILLMNTNIHLIKAYHFN
jgi:hypothetical protein